ncbi:MAG: Tim44-like domain-containing protein [Burkholderiales bacterium]
MNKTFLAVLAVVAATTLAVTDVADAKRLGGGRSLGAQRQMTPPPAAPAPTPKAAPTTPPQAAAPAAGAAAAAAAPARTGMSRWLGPIAGIAAGLGLAALLSHFGLSEGFASLLLLALVVFAGVFLVRMLLARRTPAAQSPLAYAGNAGRTEPRVEPTMAPARFEPVMGNAPAAAPAATPATGKFPPGFDPQPFAEQAKRQFMRMQAAYDAADRKALADVMTPEMFAEVSGDLASRGAHLPTEVRDLAAQVLEVTTEGSQHWMSVRFTGLLREDGTVLPKEFDEIWNLSKPVDDSSGWLLAGIQQTHALA